MRSVEAEIATPLAMFQSTCEAIGVLAGAERLNAFLRLPEWQQEAIFVELGAEAEGLAEHEGRP